MNKLSSSKLKDVQGSLRLITQSTLGITELVEAMHYRILEPPLLPSTPIQKIIKGISSITYFNIKTITQLVGKGIDKSFELLPSGAPSEELSFKREKMVATLNGVIGDHLVKSKNPLAIPLQFKYGGKVLPIDSGKISEYYPKINGKLLILIHGLCSNDLLWSQEDHDHGSKLADDLSLTPVYLHYNSGLNISSNGKELSEELEKLVQNWPVQVEEIYIVAHSMGGLISRSAIFYGEKEKKNWITLAKKIVFLGSPHHGAPLEKAGSYMDFILESIPYVKPFARLGKIRSAGITDLRYGNIIDDHWENKERFNLEQDSRSHIPLPKTITSYAIAATKSKKEGSLLTKLKGDGLVPVASAFGKHKTPEKCLNFESSNTTIIFDCKHNGLLHDKRVYDQLKNYVSE